MCGLPIISTNVGGIAKHITNERGILINPKNEDELFSAINDMIKNYSLYDKKSIAKCANDNFSMEIIGEKLNDIYNSILK